MSDATGRIFDIQRFSTHDGPGIRTTLFLKGCPLRCRWCHNPEGISPDLQLGFSPEKCTGCGSCIRACPNRAHRLERADGLGPGGDGCDAVAHLLDRARCARCGVCAAACVGGALETVGQEISVGKALREVLEDRAFYGPSGGGLTLSGGEPLLQVDFASALLRAAKDRGIHCCVETSGFSPWPHFEALRGMVDLFLYDYKETDPQRHVECTGVANGLILENLRGLYARGARIALRCPIIPGYNDREEHFAGIVALSREMPRLEAIELIPYHPLGRGKIERLGIAVSAEVAIDTPDRTAVDAWIGWFAARGIPVHCGGARARHASGSVERAEKWERTEK